MKFLLTLLFSVLLMAPQLQAATGLSGVIFTNLNKSHFWVELNAAPTNMVRINLNPTQFNTNTVNNPDGITITNISGIYGGLWTNDNHTWFPVGEEFNLQATNIVAKTTMQVDGGFSTPYDSEVLTVGANCITVGQRTLWRLAGPSTDPTDATVSFTTGDQGQWLRVIKFGTDGETFTLTDDALVCDAGGGHLRLRGNWTPTDLGETIDLVSDGNDWFEVSRSSPAIPGGDNLWKISGSGIIPVNTNLIVSLTPNLVLAGKDTSHGATLTYYDDTRSAFTLFGADGSTIGMNAGLGSVAINFNDGVHPGVARIEPTTTDGTAPYHFDTSITHTTGNIAEILNDGTNKFTVAADSGYTGAGTLFLSDDGTYKSAGGGGTTINPTDNYLPYRANSTTFGDSPWNVVTANKLGLATTNAFMFYEWAFGNIGIGEDALKNVDGVNANNNVAFGDQAGKANNAGFDNTYLGNFAGLNNQTGDQNTIVGAGAGASVIDINDTISIGAAASATNSHEIVIGTTSNTKFIVPIASWGSGDGTKVYRNDGTFGAVPPGAFTATITSLTPASPQTITFSTTPNITQWLVATGNVTIASASLSAAAGFTLNIDNQQATNINVITPIGWHPVSGAGVSGVTVGTNILAAGKIGILSGFSRVSNDTNVVSTWASE